MEEGITALGASVFSIALCPFRLTLSYVRRRCRAGTERAAAVP
ncbi:hypothetical protein SRABI76_00547 [Microbacterium oxydans]|nr:hypothetical protein SRABI76_00547 [Microbacterium oxydans]